MKTSIHTTLVLSALLGSLLMVGGCGKKNVIPPDSQTDGAMSGGTDINYPVAQGGYSEDNLPAEGTLDDSGGIGMGLSADMQSDEYKRTHGRSSENLFPIYFDFDQAGVRPDMTDVLAQNAEYLISIPGVRVVIQGNCDERGTSEYNLALGERRAINTQQYLLNLGIDTDRMRTVSFGEEQPLFIGQDEESYGYNRRVDFVIE
jgi:peptidoglycan-associated lipoprotein